MADSTSSTFPSVAVLLPGNVRSFERISIHEHRYETYASGIKRILLFAGLWPGHVSSRCFRLVVVIHLISCIVTSSGIMYFVAKHITNLSLATRGLGVGVSFYTTILKVIVFSIYRDRLVELHKILECNFRKDLTDPVLRAILLSPLKFFYHPTLWLTVSTWTLVSMYNLNPLISIIIQRSHGVDTLVHRTPYPTQYPFPDSSTLYVTRYLTEIGASFAIGSITASTDALFGFYVFQIASQFRTLSYRMANLNGSDDYRTAIKECVIRREILAECCDKLQTIYGPIILWMLMTSAMTMCANIFQASQISIDKAVLVFVYIIMKLIQTLLYGWYGLFLTTESEAFRESIYASGWPDSGDRSFSSNVLIMLMCKPLVLKACHFSTISLDMFMAITNTAVSYFFLLQTLDEK